MRHDPAERMRRARLALDGLSTGDAFGERFFGSPARIEPLLAARAFPPGPWRWTDDTAMALSVVDVLDAHGGIDRDALARAFAVRYARDPARGYGGGAHRILSDNVAGRPRREAATSAFDGQRSMGNGGAMRSAPIGAYFADDIDAVVDRARASRTAVAALGNGSNVIASDTVPLALWCAARHLDSFDDAMWTTVSALGDRDTTCAIVGGIVALRVGAVPPRFSQEREALDGHV